jgi:UDP-2,4-diacetamido-2,4,6-trideoxy-beta-L-altropyranose hydrolase
VIKATFVTAASPHIGGGHVLRCLALAESFAALGIQPRFATDRVTRDTVGLLANGPFEIVDTPPAEAHRNAGANDADVVVFDSYAFDHAVERNWRGLARVSVTIDDLANRRHDCDVLVDHGAGRLTAHYAGLVPAGCEILAGPRYALLRPEFRTLRPRALARRGAAAAQRLLIAMGLTDVGGVSRRAVEGVRQAGLGLAIDVVTGRTAGSLPWLREQAAAGTLHLHVDIEGADMAALMAAADIAIGSGGGTSLERCCLGVPTLMILLVDNQLASLTSQVEAGAATLIGDLDAATPGRIAAALRALASDPPALVARSRAAAAMVDGEGAYRVGRVVLDRLAATR